MRLLILISMPDERLAVLENDVKHVKGQVEEIHLALCGTPEAPGYPVRLDRLEQAEKTRSKIMWLFGVTFIAGLCERFLR